MADISLEFIGKQLQNIQAELHEMKFAAEVERRNNRSAFDNLVIEVGVKFGTFEATIEHRLEAMEDRLEGRAEAMQRQLDRIEQLLMSRGAPS